MGYDWVVKVDPDAVFLPERLRDRIQWMPRTTSGVMLQNCQYVDYGFFGNLEVLSVEAFDTTIDGACKAKRPTDEKKNKKWHSDCKVKVPAFHPFKKPTEYFECLDQTMAL